MKKIGLIAGALLCACQQKPAPQPPDSAASATPPVRTARVADSRPAIVAFGDSLTAGQGLDPGQSYPDLLQKQLDQLGYRYRVDNFGVSGDTTQDGLARLPTVIADKPAIVVLEFGANDGLRGLPVAGTQANLAQLIEALQKAGVRVVLAGMTLPPNYGEDYVRKFVAVYTDLAAKYQIPLIPFLLAGVAGNASLMQRDGLHPTAQGTVMVTATVLKYVQPLLQK